MRRQISGSVVVITGASSGIGKATALLLARKGARVVAAARREDALDDLVMRIERRGGRCLAVRCDVSDPAAVHGLARATVDRFGHLDVWINNAGVYLSGPMEETPLPVFERVLQTNLMGYVYGARAVLPYLRRRGHGVIINVSSVSGRMGSPYQTAYSASKFAIRGFSESLREELLDTGISVCTVMPPGIDTPLWDHSANYSGYELVPIPPVFSVHRVARAVASCITRPKAEVTIGLRPRFLCFLHDLSPTIMGALMARHVSSKHFTSKPAERTNGNLFEPVREKTGLRSRTLAGKRWRRALMLAGSVPLAALGLRRLVQSRLNA